MLFATTSMGIFLATVARTMPQFGMLMLLVMLPLHDALGRLYPAGEHAEIVQKIMLIAPNTHFVMLAQAISSAAPGSISSGRSSLPCSASAPSSSSWPWFASGNPWKPRPPENLGE